MMWWQELLALLAVGFGGAILGAWFQRQGARQERMLGEAISLASAMESLLIEVESNIQVIEDPSSGGFLLMPLSANMWEVHKGKIIYLPSKLRMDLQDAYLHVTKVNVIVQTVLLSGSGGEPPWTTQYSAMLKDAKGPSRKAKDGLKNWLKDRTQIFIQKLDPKGQKNLGDVLTKLSDKLELQGLQSASWAAIAIGIGLLSISLMLPLAEEVSPLLFYGSITCVGMGILGMLGFSTYLYIRRKITGRGKS